MKYEEGDKWLKRFQPIDRLIIEKKIQIEALYTCVGVQGISYEKISVISSPENKFENIIADITVLKDELEELQLKKAVIIEEIRDKLNSLGECPERTILFGYYLGGMRMEKLSEELGYELSWCYRLKRKGIEKL